MAKRKSDFGTLYRGREGQWSWVAHRVSGVGIIEVTRAIQDVKRSILFDRF